MKQLRIIVLFLLICFTFGNFPGFAAEDVTQPELIGGIAFDKAEYQAGEWQTVTANVKDDLSGIQEVFITLYSPNRVHFLNLTLQLRADGTWGADYKIPTYWESGNWYVSGVTVRDNAKNGIQYHYESLDLGGFILHNENADVTPPEIHSFTYDKTEVHPGETIQFTIKATDSQTGIFFVRAGFYTEADRFIEDVTVFSSNVNGEYVGSFTIPETAPSGNWKIRNLQVMDNSHNAIHLQDTPGYVGNFKVINPNEDIAPPKILSFSYDKELVQDGETITFSAEVDDDKSGVHYMYVGAVSTTGRQILTTYTFAFSSPGIMTAEMKIPKHAETGKWYIFSITLHDHAGNFKHFVTGNRDTHRTFTVTNNFVFANTALTKLEEDIASVTSWDKDLITSFLTRYSETEALIAVLSGSELKKVELTNRLLNVKQVIDLANATYHIREAEETKKLGVAEQAKALVDLLPEGENKNLLKDRLAQVFLYIEIWDTFELLQKDYGTLTDLQIAIDQWFDASSKLQQITNNQDRKDLTFLRLSIRTQLTDSLFSHFANTKEENHQLSATGIRLLVEESISRLEIISEKEKSKVVSYLMPKLGNQVTAKEIIQEVESQLP